MDERSTTKTLVQELCALGFEPSAARNSGSKLATALKGINIDPSQVDFVATFKKIRAQHQLDQYQVVSRVERLPHLVAENCILWGGRLPLPVKEEPAPEETLTAQPAPENTAEIKEPLSPVVDLHNSLRAYILQKKELPPLKDKTFQLQLAFSKATIGELDNLLGSVSNKGFKDIPALAHLHKSIASFQYDTLLFMLATGLAKADSTPGRNTYIPATPLPPAIV